VLGQLAKEELKRGSKRTGGQAAGKRSDATGTQPQAGLVKINSQCQKTLSDLGSDLSAPSRT
jgi:hypothetical protein